MNQNSSRNILGRAKLADFGYSRHSQGSCKTVTTDKVTQIEKGAKIYMNVEGLDVFERYLLSSWWYI